MEPQRKHLNALAIAGPSVRTTNAEEADPATGRIPGLWAAFFRDNVMGLTPNRNMAELRNFGVYSGYASDANGAFDVTAGVAVTQGASVEIEAGEYLVFEARGPMPQAVLDAWMAAWRYVEAHPDIRRRYVSDFEAYSSPVDVAVYLGVA